MGDQTFCGLPRRNLAELAAGSVAIIGAAHASPYERGGVSHSAEAPAALRAASALFATQRGQFDFDTAAAFLPKAGGPTIVDCGDLPLDPSAPAANRRVITEAVSQTLSSGARPVLLGGDDSVPVAIFPAYAGRGPLTIVQVDAHVDWGDVILGNPFGCGSTMRRASEQSCVARMVQVGIRGLGSGTADQMDDARHWGSRILTMDDLDRHGIEAALGLIEAGANCFISVDFDGLDPAIMPAVNMPTPGGLSYRQALKLIAGVAAKARIVGCAFVEFAPDRDVGRLGAVTAARLIASALCLM